MDNDLYRNLIYTIRMHWTWITVADADSYETFFLSANGEIYPIRCRVLTLEVRIPEKNFSRGHRWKIPEYRLDVAVRELKKDRQFKLRYTARNLTMSDVETIIGKASHGLISLELESL